MPKRRASPSYRALLIENATFLMLVSVVGEAPVEEDLVEDVEPVGSEAERGLISTKSDSTCTEVHSNVLYTVSIFCTEIQTKENGNRDGTHLRTVERIGVRKAPCISQTIRRPTCPRVTDRL